MYFRDFSQYHYTFHSIATIEPPARLPVRGAGAFI